VWATHERIYNGITVKFLSDPRSTLIGIKLLHTAIWLFFASCILALPVAGMRRQFYRATLLATLVMAECVVLALNRFRCPLTDLAARYTEDRRDNFDIYLPVWLARHNQTIFGTLFVAGGLLVLWQWLRSRQG
jgi:hypothetical protein